MTDLLPFTKGALHPDDCEIFNRAETLAFWLADCIQEDLKVFEHKRRPHDGGALGICYVNEKRIAIVVRFKYGADMKLWGEPEKANKWHRHRLPDNEIFRTVAHEVAHLVHPNHSQEFKELEARLWEYAKQLYRIQE